MDEVDLIADIEERLLDAMKHARRPIIQSQRTDIHCVSCGEEIPAARRAVTNSCLCVECLEQMERGMGR